MLYIYSMSIDVECYKFVYEVGRKEEYQAV